MIGRSVVLLRVVTPAAVDDYCALTGDDDPLHVDAAFAATTVYRERIAPGALIIGYMMAAATAATGNLGIAVPSLGFDRLRHTRPVVIGDRLRVEYTVVSVVDDRGHADITVTNQRDETVAVADHVFRILSR
jgi:3-hydroxybutyryl-CoA dehydratase